MDWFTELTGLASDAPGTVRAGITLQGDWLICHANGRRLRAGQLATPALADLPRPDPPHPDQAQPGRLTLREVIADVRDLHADPANAGAVFQVASQFNLLEMVGPWVTPERGIAGYAHDLTQGPACAMACAAGTILRNYLVPLDGQTGQSAGRQIDTLADLGHALGNADGRLWAMRNGYLLPEPYALPTIAALIAGRETGFRDLVRLGVQAGTEVTLPGAGHCVTQIYASALPVAYGQDSPRDWEPFARLVLEAAYEATFRIAHAHAQATGNRRLFLTRLGGGAFGNDDAWINDAIRRAIARLPGLDLDVALVSHGRSHPATAALLAKLAPRADSG